MNAKTPEELVAALEAQGYGQYTIKQYLILASEFEEAMEGTSTIRAYRTNSAYKFRHAYKDKTRCVKESEFTELLQKASNRPDIYNFLLLTGRAGLRRSEALAARHEDFVDNKFLKVIGKGNKQRLIPFQRSQLLSSLPPTQAQTGVIVSSFRAVNKFLKQASVTPHDFRSMFITNQLNISKLNVKEAALVAGHSSIITTSRYIRTDLEDIARKMGV
jgi:integrase